MPIVDLNTGFISGCKRNSLTWYHEEGHILFNQTETGNTFGYSSEMFPKIILLLMIVNFWFNNFWIWFFEAGLFCGIIFFYAYEEIWCWNYAYKYKKLNYLKGVKK